MPGRDDLALLAALDWTPIVVALITLISSLGVAALNVWVVLHLRTPSGTRIGKQVENNAHLTIDNRNLLVRVAREMGIRADDPQLRQLRDDDAAR